MMYWEDGWILVCVYISTRSREINPQKGYWSVLMASAGQARTNVALDAREIIAGLERS